MPTYAYDGQGLRVSATTTITSKATGDSKTTTRDYLFDLGDRVIYDKVISATGQLPAAEDPETSTENSYVFANSTHFAKVEGAIGSIAEVYYYHNDHLGSSMAITDKDGNLAWSQDYLPYGEALNENAAQTKTRFTFTGKELDSATGLMYYNARWYDQDLGRFMTEDAYAGDPNQPLKLNKYLYVIDNPLRYTDPTGHDVGFAGTDPSKEHFDEKTGRVVQGKASDEQMQERWADLHERDGRHMTRDQLKREANAYQKIGGAGVEYLKRLSAQKWKLAGATFAGAFVTVGTVAATPAVPIAVAATPYAAGATAYLGNAALLAEAASWYIGESSSMSLLESIVLGRLLKTNPGQSLDFIIRQHVRMAVDAFGFAIGLDGSKKK